MSDIQELFDRDPLTFTKEGQEVEQIISYLREQRQKHMQGVRGAGSMKAPKEVKAPSKPVSLDDLGL